MAGDFGGTPPPSANQRDRFQPVLVGPLDCLDDIRRTAADAECQNHIALLPVILQLPDENVLVSVIVADGAHPTDIVIQREAAKTPVEFVRRALPQVRSEVRRVGRAAAVAENKNVAILMK